MSLFAIAKYGIPIILVILPLLVLWQDYNGLRREVNLLRENEAALQLALDTQQETLNLQRTTLEEWQTQLNEFNQRIETSTKVARDARAETVRLRGIFAEHNLSNLAKAKPGLIENRINRGTYDINRLFECATGLERSDCPDPNSSDKPPSPPPP